MIVGARNSHKGRTELRGSGHDGWWAIGLAILLSPIGYVFGATAYVIVGLVVAVAIMIVAFNVR